MSLKMTQQSKMKSIIGYAWYNVQHVKHIKQNKNLSNFFDIYKERVLGNSYIFHNSYDVAYHYKLQTKERLRSFLLHRSYCTSNPKSADIFGDLGNRKYERVEMDEAEEEEEEYENNRNVSGNRIYTFNPHTKLLKDHVNKGDLESAEAVLNDFCKRHPEPTAYVYNLVIFGYAKQGNVKKCFKLYNDMKKRAIKPTDSTYTSLFNACANSENTANALKHLNDLRHTLYDKQYPLNDSHYHVMMKAYSWHKQFYEAFQLADEMIDKRIPVDIRTFHSLFHGAIADKEAGLRHALILWQVMKIRKIKPTVDTYNLLLTAIKDTKFGNIVESNKLLRENLQFSFINEQRPDLLANPPVINISLLSSISNKETPTLECVDSTSSSTTINELLIYLDDILCKNPLLLFGGAGRILERMENDNVQPDIKTLTILAQLVPDTVNSENEILKYARVKNIPLDVTFYNALIKKRSLRFDYMSARDVLNNMQDDYIRPNIMTFGVLALGCTNPNDARELLEVIECMGYSPNIIIIGTLMKIFCHQENTAFVIELMNYVSKCGLSPNEKMYAILDEYEKKKFYKRGKKYKHYISLAEFREKYKRFKEKMKRDV